MFWVLLGFFFLAVCSHMTCFLLGGRHEREKGYQLGLQTGLKQGLKDGLSLGDSQTRERAVSDELAARRKAG